MIPAFWKMSYNYIMAEYKRRAKRLKSGDRDYVSNPEFYEALVDYLEKNKIYREKTGDPEALLEPSEYIINCIMSICKRRLNSWNYNKYDFKDEMLSAAYLDCFKDLTRFNPDLPGRNPFAYFTTIASNAFSAVIKNEKKQLYTKYLVIDDIILFDELGTNIQHYGTPEEEEHKNLFVQKYNQSMLEKKMKADQKKKEKKMSNKRSLIV